MYKSLFFISIVFLISCRGNMKNKKLDKLFQETMVIHDDIMPEMSTIHRSKKKIRKILESTTDSLTKVQLMDGIKFLELADDAMMNWMENFEKPKDDAPFEESKKYLLYEKEKIKQVKNMMVDAIKTAKDLTNENI